MGLVSGSGIALRPLLDEELGEIPFDAIPGLSAGTVPGHACTFVFGRCAGHPVVLQCGRRHVYEGLSFSEVGRSIEVMREFGVARVVFTNAAGGTRPEMAPGHLVGAERIRCWPFRGLDFPEELPLDFVAPGCDFAGTFQWMHGPCYETPAEIRAIAGAGCATVGMSGAAELLRCRELGMRAALVSCVTNACARPQALSHEEVLAVARHSSERMRTLLREGMPHLREA